MGNDTQSNEEQMQMLLMTLEEVPHGICLFQSENQAKRVSLIQERLGTENVIVHNIADDDEEKGMVTSQDFKRWASESDANVVIVYNLQLLGMRFGDEEVIEKLNFMRDQILAIGKLFVFGVSSYFNRLLSRNARDLYSCILYHFSFVDSEKKVLGVYDFRIDDLSGDDVLETSKYMEMKERIQNNSETKDISIYLECMKSWNSVRAYLSYREREFITELASEVDQQYRQKNIEIADIENIWILADTWIGLENAERSVSWYEKVLCLVKEKLDENHELYADALVEYTNYYEAVCNFKICEDFYNQAIKIYDEKQMRFSSKGRTTLMSRANMYCGQLKLAEALETYQDLLDYQIDKYGEKYYGNAYLYNNIGTIYFDQGEYSNALLEYKKALELFNNAGKKGGWLVEIYQNICVIYLKNGDGSEAWKYIKKAKKIVEDVYGKRSSKLIYIYNSMSGVWNVRERPDKELEYLQKALSLMKEIHMEESEVAVYIYNNLADLLCRGGRVYEAITFCKYAIKTQEKVYGEKNELAAISYEQLAFILYKKSDYMEAKKMLDKARRIYVSLYGSQNDNVKRVDDYLKVIHS